MKASLRQLHSKTTYIISNRKIKFAFRNPKNMWFCSFMVHPRSILVQAAAHTMFETFRVAEVKYLKNKFDMSRKSAIWFPLHSLITIYFIQWLSLFVYMKIKKAILSCVSSREYLTRNCFEQALFILRRCLIGKLVSLFVQFS